MGGNLLGDTIPQVGGQFLGILPALQQVVGAAAHHHVGHHNLALALVGNTNDGSFRHIVGAADHGLDLGGGQPVPGHVNNIVGAAKNPNVAVLVPLRAVASCVVALVGKLLEVGAVESVRRPTRRAAYWATGG